VLNAADEVAVSSFLAGEIPFNGISEVIERTMNAVEITPVRHFSDLYRADEEARAVAVAA
jgi:1-deoxy-D-xylulose-5-phosphate reductoisomerase